MVVSSASYSCPLDVHCKVGASSSRGVPTEARDGADGVDRWQCRTWGTRQTLVNPFWDGATPRGLCSQRFLQEPATMRPRKGHGSRVVAAINSFDVMVAGVLWLCYAREGWMCYSGWLQAT